jgi:hypothetical protein
MVKCGVLFEVRAEFLYIIKTSVGLKGLMHNVVYLKLLSCTPRFSTKFSLEFSNEQKTSSTDAGKTAVPLAHV